MLRKYNEIKEEMKKPETSVEYTIWNTVGTYCVSCKKNTANTSSSVRKTKQKRLVLLSNCAVCAIKSQLSLRIKKLIIFPMISLKGIKSLTNFYWLETIFCKNCIRNSQEILTVLVDHLLNIVKELKKFRGTGSLKHLYRNELDKACFANDAAYSDSKDLTKRIISDKILKDRGYEIAWNWKHDGYHRALASMVYKFFW